MLSGDGSFEGYQFQYPRLDRGGRKLAPRSMRCLRARFQYPRLDRGGRKVWDNREVWLQSEFQYPRLDRGGRKGSGGRKIMSKFKYFSIHVWIEGVESTTPPY